MKKIITYLSKIAPCSPFGERGACRGAFFLALLLLAAVSCNNKETYPESPDLTVIYGISIVNAGEAGNQILVGKVDEINKEISFPDVDTLTDFSRIRFEAELPERAHLDEEVYNFSMGPADTRLTRTIAVLNGIRKREYSITIKKDVPVWGADFDREKIEIYNFSNNGGAAYSDLSAGSTRSADMDSNYVLLVSRATAPHLLRMADLAAGNISSPIMLDLTGVADGTFAYSSGRLSHGHIYICNLAVLGNATPQTLKIYHYASPTAVPELVGSFSKGVDGIPDYATNGGRFGDAMSVELDENGNGYIFIGNNRGTVAADPYVLRLSVTNFTTIASPEQINPPTYGGWWSNYRQVDGAANEYIYTGYASVPQLVDAAGGAIYAMASGSVPLQGNDATVVSFNKERYLVMQSSTQGTEAATLYVYDITTGATTQEALEFFDNRENKNALYTCPLGGAAISGVYASNLGVAKTENALYLMGAAPGGGFVVVRAPKAVKAE
ncbi:MAG: DUF4623 domain-containing protein [Prevotellaceae bacterium]|jgi:hypothetical protein|nr:DUF4623 domain-containing protein [Prevotellaceae bacterium]